jgi:signal peptidase I
MIDHHDFYSIYDIKNIPNAKFAEILKTLISEGLSIKFRAGGNSMFPFICDGDIITVSPVSTSPKIGDVVVLFSPLQILIVHRIISKKKNLYFTKGDNAYSIDQPVDFLDIIGVVKQVKHKHQNIIRNVRYGWIIALFSNLNMTRFYSKIIIRLRRN